MIILYDTVMRMVPNIIILIYFTSETIYGNRIGLNTDQQSMANLKNVESLLSEESFNVVRPKDRSKQQYDHGYGHHHHNHHSDLTGEIHYFEDIQPDDVYYNPSSPTTPAIGDIIFGIDDGMDDSNDRIVLATINENNYENHYPIPVNSDYDFVEPEKNTVSRENITDKLQDVVTSAESTEEMFNEYPINRNDLWYNVDGKNATDTVTVQSRSNFSEVLQSDNQPASVVKPSSINRNNINKKSTFHHHHHHRHHYNPSPASYVSYSNEDNSDDELMVRRHQMTQKNWGKHARQHHHHQHHKKKSINHMSHAYHRANKYRRYKQKQQEEFVSKPMYRSGRRQSPIIPAQINFFDDSMDDLISTNHYTSERDKWPHLTELQHQLNEDIMNEELPPYVKKYKRRNHQLLNLLDGTIAPSDNHRSDRITKKHYHQHPKNSKWIENNLFEEQRPPPTDTSTATIDPDNVYKDTYHTPHINSIPGESIHIDESNLAQPKVGAAPSTSTSKSNKFSYHRVASPKLINTLTATNSFTKRQRLPFVALTDKRLSSSPPTKISNSRQAQHFEPMP